MDMVKNYLAITSQPEYDVEFWNLIRNKPSSTNALSKGGETATGTYNMPSNSLKVPVAVSPPFERALVDDGDRKSVV